MKNLVIRSFALLLVVSILIVSLTSCGQIDFGLRDVIESGKKAEERVFEALQRFRRYSRN